MKKLLLILLISAFVSGYGQTKLASHPLKLIKSPDYHQILNAVNTKDEVFVFASDKENFHLLKFNNALFFSDSLHLKRPDKSYEIMAGYSFGETGSPYVYWTSQDFKKVLAVQYDLARKKATTYNFALELKNESIESTFTENDIFYILTQGDKDDFLKLYVFNNGTLIEKTLDFSAFAFTNPRNKPIKFHELIPDYPIEKMDSKNFNPLFYSIQKSKLYIENNILFLTLDHNPGQTQLFSIDLATFSISENKIPQPELQNSKSESNSFLFGNHLYQLRLNQDQMTLVIKVLPSVGIVKTFSVQQKDSIDFKNSPLYVQNGDAKPRELKSTQKFLRRLSSANVGLSVYRTQDKNLVTVGRAKNVARTGDILMGVTLTVGTAVGGGGGIVVGDLFEDTVQSIYFESLLDDNLQHLADKPEPLAIDYIAEFRASHDELRYDNTFHYKDFFILGYYDIAAEEYVLRKFRDGFD